MESKINHQNRKFIATLYNKYGNELKYYLISYTHDMMQAEDMLQDIFERLLHIDIISEESANGLLFLMARRMMIDDARHRSIIKKANSNIVINTGKYYISDIDNKIDYSFLHSKELVKLGKMPRKRAEIYRLCEYDELTSNEISQQLNISRRTVESHLYNARKEMKEYLQHII